MMNHELIDLPTLLEVIQTNLAFNIDSIYSQVNRIVPKGTTHNIGFLKEKLKEQIENYLKCVVKNIKHKILYQEFDDYIKELNEAVCEHLTIVPRSDLSWYCRDCKKEGA